MQCEQTVLLYEVVQIDTQRPQPVSVGYGRTGHGALPYSVQSRHNHVGTAKHWRAHSRGKMETQPLAAQTKPNTNPEATAHKTNTFPSWQRFWPLILMAFDMQRIQMAGEMLQEREEVSAFIS